MSWNFLCFNKCGFTNVSSGENIFLLFLRVASLGLSVEAKPIVLTLTLFFPTPVLFSFLFFLGGGGGRGNKSLVLVPSLASIPLTCWVLCLVAVETGAMTHSQRTKQGFPPRAGDLRLVCSGHCSHLFPGAFNTCHG